MTKLDDILPKIGGNGLYQKRLFVLLALPTVNTAVFMVMMAYAMYTPYHRCAHSPTTNTTIGLNNVSRIDQYEPNISTTVEFDQCHVRYTTYHRNVAEKSSVYNETTSERCSAWTYDTDIFYNTFATTNDLVCDDSLKTAHAQMVYYFGVGLGDICLGAFSDRFGRKTALFLALLLLFVSSFAASWAPGYYSFVVFEFIVGIANRGASVLIFVFVFEYSAPAARVGVAMLYCVLCSIGLCLLSVTGYIIRDWKYIQIVSSIPLIIYLFFWWVISESPRWLISKGRQEEARKILQNIARVNNVDIPRNCLQNITVKKNESGKIWQLFKSRILLCRLLIVFFNWFSLGLTYYGVFLHAGSMGVDFYLAQLILAVIEIPVYLPMVYLLNKFGRKKVHFTLIMLGGIACICSIFPVVFGGKELQPVLFALAVVGKIGASGAFASAYVLSGEIYPTVIRNGAFGASSSGARIGSMVAPYVAKTNELVGGQVGNALPLTIFGIVAVAAGLLCLLLPETMGCPLPDTIEEAENLGRLKTENKTARDYEPECNQ